MSDHAAEPVAKEEAPKAPNRLRVLLPWALFGLALCGSGGLYVLKVMPLTHALATRQEEAQKALASLDELEKAKSQVEAELQTKEHQVAEALAAERHEDGVKSAVTVADEDAKLTLKDLIRREFATVETHDKELVVTLQTHLLFVTGELELTVKGKELLRALAHSLLRHGEPTLTIAGHTDNQPLPLNMRGRLPSNWERSLVEATTVLHFLETEVHVPPKNLSAQGFSEFRPLIPNDKANGRKANRRIEFRVSNLGPKERVVAEAHHP